MKQRDELLNLIPKLATQKGQHSDATRAQSAGPLKELGPSGHVNMTSARSVHLRGAIFRPAGRLPTVWCCAM